MIQSFTLEQLEKWINEGGVIPLSQEEWNGCWGLGVDAHAHAAYVTLHGIFSRLARAEGYVKEELDKGGLGEVEKAGFSLQLIAIKRISRCSAIERLRGHANGIKV